VDKTELQQTPTTKDDMKRVRRGGNQTQRPRIKTGCYNADYCELTFCNPVTLHIFFIDLIAYLQSTLNNME
jgi:hypothetical protein